MMISLLYPSRGRPAKSYKTFCSWHAKASGDIQIQTIVSVDQDDELLREYVSLYPNISIFRKNTCVVEATNYAASHSTGDILVYLSDDFDCPQDWDKSIEKEFKGVTDPMLLKVDDCLQKFDVAVLTIPIMNRQLYDKLGYFFHPGYKSMFCDEHLYWRAKRLHALRFAPHLKFEHKHVSVGKAKDDETYRRSAANWDQGKALFAQHKAAGFPV